jgi:thioredoxin 1
MKTNPKRWRTVLLGAIIALAVAGAVRSQFFAAQDATPASSTQSAVNAGSGKVTMIDLGATECIPCKMMAPIIEELQKEYAGRADIIFIDVWKHPDQARKYGIRAIPTQIFYDAGGKEVHRNVGFMDKKRIVEVLTRLGAS